MIGTIKYQRAHIDFCLCLYHIHSLIMSEDQTRVVSMSGSVCHAFNMYLINDRREHIGADIGDCLWLPR